MITNKRTGEVSHVGQVFGYRSKEERIMSDVYATVQCAAVWTGTTVEFIPVANSEFGASATFTVDADDTIKAHVFNYFVAQATARMQAERARVVAQCIAAAKEPAIGREVEVVKGRKLAHGLTGIVFWMGDKGWGMSVGIEINKPGPFHGKRVFTSAKNVSVVNPDEYVDMDFATDAPDYSAAANKEAAAQLLQLVPNANLLQYLEAR